MVKNSLADARDTGDVGSMPGSGRFPWRRKWQPTPAFLPEESHGQRSLVGYSPWGLKGSDTTEAAWHARVPPKARHGSVLLDFLAILLHMF